jgi:hypothetical protein
MARSTVPFLEDAIKMIDLAETPARKRAPRKPKSLKESIAAAVTKSEQNELLLQKTHEVTLRKTGEVGYPMPWGAGTPCPWGPGYSRIVIPLKQATRSGARCKTLIVKNSNLIHGRAA